MKIIHILISDLFGDFIYLQLVLHQKLLGMLDPDMINIGVKAFAHGFIKDLAKVGAVIAKQRCDGFQFDIGLIIMVNILENII